MHKSDDGLLHLCWKDRKTGTVEDDLILFPEEAEWLRVAQCTTGRVFVLKFKTSSQRLFFWMQEPKTDRDEEWTKKINEIINNPAAATVQRQNDGDEEMMEAGDEEEALQQLMRNGGLSAQQQQLLQMLGGMGRPPAAAAAAPAGGARSSAGTTASSTGATAGTTGTTATGAQQRSSSPQRAAATGQGSTRLSQALTPDLLRPVFRDANLRQRLFPHLPPGHDQTESELTALIQSPQFQQAVQSLDVALQSGELGPLLAEMGLDPSIATASGDRVLALLRAIQRRQQQQ